MSINDQWVRYLAAEGYVGNVNDMLQQALQSETGSNLKQVNSLWVEYLRGEGYSGSLNDMMYQWLGDKGYTGSLNDRWMQALINDDVFGPGTPTCTVTLTSEDAAGFGLSPWPVISGATASIPSSVDSTTYYVSTNTLASPVVVDWSGWRAIQAVAPIDDWSVGGVGIAAVRAADGWLIQASYVQGKSSWEVSVFDGAFVQRGKVELPSFTDPDDRVTFLIDGGSGDIQVVIGGAVAATKDTTPTSGSLSAMGAYLDGGAVAIGCIAIAGDDGDSISFTVYPAASQMTPIPVSGVLDWCGQDTVPYDPPAPSCTITLTGDIAASFGGQPLDISGQVVSKTVPAGPANAYIAGAASTISGWSGWRAVGYRASDFTTAGDSEHTLFVFNTLYTAYVGLLYSNAGSGAWMVLVNGTPSSIIAGTSDDKVAIRVDGASGDVEVQVNGVIKMKADIPALGGLFSGAGVFPAAILGSVINPTLTEGDTYSAQIFTAAEDLADFGLPSGTLDWCGDAI